MKNLISIECNMIYTTASHITSVKDVEVFFHHLVEERKVNFHPNDDFADYVSLKDHTPTFSVRKLEYIIALWTSLLMSAINQIQTFTK